MGKVFKLVSHVGIRVRDECFHTLPEGEQMAQLIGGVFKVHSDMEMIRFCDLKTICPEKLAQMYRHKDIYYHVI